mmetsp:Transcript_8035/g.29424  ORF Transcript_8035/g.29424 Transcript_8035/m.29424 type:complete len:347 (+) Transcript_8035:203-1243(+)
MHARARHQRRRDAVVQRVQSSVQRREGRRRGERERGGDEARDRREDAPYRDVHGRRADARPEDGWRRHPGRERLHPRQDARHRRFRGGAKSDARADENAVRDQDNQPRRRRRRGARVAERERDDDARRRRRRRRGAREGVDRGHRGRDKDDDVRVLRDAARGQGARFLRHAHQSVHRHGAPEGRGHARARHRERGGKAIRKRRRGLRQSAALGPRRDASRGVRPPRHQARELALRGRKLRAGDAAHRGLRVRAEDDVEPEHALGAVRHPRVRCAGDHHGPVLHPRGGLLGRGRRAVRRRRRAVPVRRRGGYAGELSDDRGREGARDTGVVGRERRREGSDRAASDG